MMHTALRLFTQFQPKRYDLTLDISQRKDRIFSGNVVITGETVQERSLQLHAKDLEIADAYCGTDLLKIDRTDDDTIALTGAIPAGAMIELTINFSGKITDGMHGIYPCYFEVNGRQEELLATQFESHHAREVFPCVDEPEAKAVFNVSLITEPDVIALSNMPRLLGHVDEFNQKDDKVQHFFEETPRMSTYLVAFVVGDLQKKSGTTKSGVDVSVWATKAQSGESLAFPLDVAIKTIEFFNDYFGAPYPLPKADHVALPDFSAGAMENWGLITYREIALLVDAHSSVSMREYVATVIAHETSHQWFGNLVTMRWWDDLWLNESFATLMEYVAVDALYPEWHVWNTFASQETLSALRRDQLSGVQAVKSEVNHPDEISTLFDPSIVYAKGARLLKMLRSYIGEEAFQNGLRHYFQTHAYSNTVGSDLWQAFAASSSKDIASFMDTWISQPGLPLVSVKTATDGYVFSQERFVLGKESGKSIWPIPLFSIHAGFPELLDQETLAISTAHALPLLNRNNDAHFVTQYDENGWDEIRQALHDGKLEVISRLSVLHETSLLARGGKTDTAALLVLLPAYEREDSEPVWNIISMIIGDLKRFVEDNPASEENLKVAVRRLATPLYKKLGFDQIEGEAEQDTKLRAIILGLLSYAEEETVIERALELYHQAEDLQSLPSEIRGVILSIAAKHGNDDDFKRLLVAHSETANAELRDDITSGLCATKDEMRYKQLLERLKNPNVVKQQDVFRWYIYLLRNRHSRQEAWSWMTNNWLWIEQTFKGDKSYDDFARYSASVLSTREWLTAYQTFFGPLRTQKILRRAIEVGEVEITSRMEWLERDMDSVRAKLVQETQ